MANKLIVRSSLTIFLSIFLLFRYGYAATINVNCGSASAVQSGFNTANNGDTVQCSGSGSYTWSSAVTMSSSKYITFDLNSATITLSGTSTELIVQSHATGINRITNGGINRGSGYSTNYEGPIRPTSTADYAAIVFGDIDFDGSNVLITTAGVGPILFYSCNFLGLSRSQETIHVKGGSWSDYHEPGSQNAVYFEDCYWEGPASSGRAVATDLYRGARVVMRHNTARNVTFTVHGDNNTGNNGRWAEYYENELTGSNSIFCTRAGSGIYFNNTGLQNWAMVEEDQTSYPGTHQVGRGQNNALWPVYVWNNDDTPCLNCGGICAGAQSNMVKLNRDVYYPSSGTSLPGSCSENQAFWKTDEGGNWDTTHGGANDGILYKCSSGGEWEEFYTPYTYPHPARSDNNGSSNNDTLKPVVSIDTVNDNSQTNDFYISQTGAISLAGTSADQSSINSVDWSCPTCTPTSGNATGTEDWTIPNSGDIALSVSTIGEELITNGSFTNDAAGWSTRNTTLFQGSYDGRSGCLGVGDNGSYSEAYQIISGLENGATYILFADVNEPDGVSHNGSIYVDFGSSYTESYGNVSIIEEANQGNWSNSLHTVFTISGTSVTVRLHSEGSSTAYFDNISLRKVTTPNIVTITATDASENENKNTEELIVVYNEDLNSNISQIQPPQNFRHIE